MFQGSRKSSFMWDSGYYDRLTSKKLAWTQKEVSDLTNDLRERWQWEGVNEKGSVRAVLLNTDVCLIQDLVLAENGQSSCDFNTCVRNENTRRYNQLYGSNN